MARKYFNWKLAIVLVIGLVIVAVTAYGLRQWLKSSRAENALKIGNKAYEKQEWSEAAQNLGRYISANPNDIPALLKYAEAQLNIRPIKSNNIQQAVGAYRNILRIEKSNLKAAVQLTELYLGMGMPGEAELIAQRALEVNQDAELRRMLALSFAGQRKFDEAASELKDIVKNYPNYVLAYETLWQLTKQKPELSSESPDHWINMAVENNPSSALAYIIRANSHLVGGDMVSALADLDQAEKQDLSDSKVRLRLAVGFMNANAMDRAEKHLAALQTIEPANQNLWQTWALLAQRSGSEEKMLETAESGLKALSSQPWDFMPTAVELFIRCNKLDQAVECISQLRQKEIDSPTIAFYEGLIADQKGLSLEAIKCWQRAIQLGNKTPRVRLTLASALARSGNSQSAMQELRTLVSERPDSFDGRLALARLLAQTGNWAQAAESANMALQLSPNNLDAILLRLQSQIELLTENSTERKSQSVKDMENQLSAMEKATDGTVAVKLLQLRLAMKLGNFADAGTLITKLKQENPTNVGIALAEVELLAAQNKMDEALSLSNSIMEQFPDAVEPVMLLASLLAQQNNREKCEAVIKDALVRIKQPAAQRRLNLLLIQFCMRWEQRDKAYSLLDALARQFPDDISIKRQLLAFEMTNNNFEKAQQHVNEIKTLEGDTGWQWRYEQSRLWFGGKDFKNHQTEIISLLKENLLANPDDQASRILLAATYEKTGDLQLALSTYRQALERSPHDIRIIIPVASALYRAKEYNEADEVLNRAAAEKLYHPDLQGLQLQSYLREGQLDSASLIMDELIARNPNDKDAVLSLAILKMRQSKFNEADQLLGKLRTMDPDAFSVIIAQVQSDILQNKAEEAIKLCDEAVARLNNLDAYILRSRTFATLNQPDKAIKDLDHVVAVEPDNVNVWVARSDFYRSVGQPDKASADINHALSLAPDNLGVQKRAISLFLTSGNSDAIQQGRALLDKALEANPDDVELQMTKARLLIAEGTAPAIANAAERLQKITENQPRIDEAWVLLGNLLLRQGQSSKAMDVVLRGLVNNPINKPLLLLKASVEAGQSPALAIPTLKGLLDMDPNNLEVAVNLANAYVEAKEPEKAVTLLREQLNMCGDTASRQRCNAALAVALFRDGKKDEAEKILTSLSELNPDDNRVLFVQISLLREKGQYADILSKAREWFERHPQDVRTPVAVAEGLMAAGDGNKDAIETAEKILRMVIAKMPDNTMAIQSLAIVLQIAGRNSEAASLNQRLIEIDPSNVVAMNNLAWVLCEEQGKYQETIELADKGLKIAPQYVDLMDTRGVAYYRLGKYDKAIEDFTACLKLYPVGASGRISSYFHLARAFAAAGEKTKAVEYLNETLNIQNQSGGLSPKDLDEAQRLLKGLSKEN